MKHGRSILMWAMAILGIAMVIVVPAVFAQVNLGLTPEVGEELGLATTDVRIVAARIIRSFFGLLGIVAVLLILYGGFLWMTAAGNEEKVDKAKKVLVSAVIGLAIMLSAFAIAQFVISRLSEATGIGPGRGAGAGAGGGRPGAGLPSNAFFVRSFSPTGDVPIRNVTVRVILSRNVDGASLPGNLTVAGPGGPVDGTITSSGAVVEFAPSAPCPDPNADRFCFDPDASFTVTVTGGVRSADGQGLLCGGLAPVCTAQFRTGTLVDVSAPSVVEIISPDPGQSVPADSLVPVQVHAVDDAGISFVEITADGRVVGNATPVGVVADFTGTEDWDTTDVAVGNHSLSARAEDVDSNEASSNPVGVVVRPAACFNRVLDADETGVDCGGQCGACAGGACTQDGDCASGACREGTCVDIPRIDAVSPGDGAPGTLVTISGNFFGSQGRVVFLGGEGEGDDTIAELCSGDAWAGGEVTVSVPAGAAPGPIQIVSGNGQGDRTDDGRGPNLPDFIVNDVARPGICSVSPNRGIPGGGATLRGANFGDEQGAGGVVFTSGGRDTNAPAVDAAAWNPDEVRAVVPTIPVIVETAAMLRVRANGLDSNSKSFTLLPPEAGTLPRVDAVDPASGPPGQYVTVRGENFGSVAGTILFQLPDGTSAVGSTDFPAACSLDFWKPTSVTVKVPARYRDGVTSIEQALHAAKVVRNDRVESNTVDFTVNAAEAGPGICLLNPDNGPEGTRIAISGERLGNLVGGVRFSADVLADAVNQIDWTNTAIRNVRVPSGAISGPAVALRGGAESSNGLPFAVGVCTTDGDCRAGLTCCGDGSCRTDCAAATPAGGFQYRFSTGIIPIVPQVVEDRTCREDTQSPSPFRFTIDGCVNALVSARINTDMDDASLQGALTVTQCNTGAEAFDAASCATPVSGPSPTVGPWRQSGDIITFQPDPALQPSTWYQVTIDGTSPGGARAVAGLFLDGDKDGEEGGDYVWVFKTRDQTDVCAVDHVEVTPADFLAQEQDETIVYLAHPTAANCNILECSVYTWLWESVYADGSTAFTQAGIAPIAGRPACEERATARAETPPGNPALITATLVSEGKSDSGELEINYLDPEVVRFWPSCTAACPNAQAGGDFNTAIDESTLNNQVITVHTCTNESCNALVEPNGIVGVDVVRSVDADDGAARGFTLTGPVWATDAYYRVIVRGGATGIRSTSGALLARTNYGDAFSWTFKTKEDADLCDIDRVEVSPPAATVRIFGDVAPYRAVPRGAPDACDADGQRLQSTDFDWGWSAATLVPDDPQVIVTRLDPPALGEFDLLPLTILDSATGRVVRSGPGCTASCLHSGTLARAVCGNTRTEAGEDCDDGNTRGGDGCSASCVHEGSSGGAVCGDGIPDIARGEDCDFGQRCSISGAACGSDADCGDGGGFCAPNGGRECSGSRLECIVDADCADGSGCRVVAIRGCTDTCVNAGSREGGSVCGNGDTGDGEDCDDGNSASGDGCSFICTNEGSLPGPLPVCGNGSPPEDGEDCDDGNITNGDGCSNFCLHEGSTGDAVVCGDSLIDPVSEDCDDGNTNNGDGCSARCLAEGSSPRYGFSYASGSYCGNGGIPETGEECEYDDPPADNNTDPVGYARATFGGEAELTCSTANLAGAQVSGTADFTFACTCTADADCQNFAPAGDAVGCGSGSCCYLRPRVAVVTPPNGWEHVCRNALVSARFTQVMDRGSLTGNVILAEERGPEACPAGRAIRGFDALCASTIEGRTAEAEVTIGDVSGTVVSFLPKSPLARRTNYSMVILGDPDTADNAVEGVRSRNGVGMDGNYSWSFTTGDEICTLDLVKASWTGLPTVRETYLFSSAQNNVGDDAGEDLFDLIADSDKVAYAGAFTIRNNGREEEIAPNNFYGWEWSWASSDGDADGNPAPIHLEYPVPSDPTNQSIVRTVSGPQNGTVTITARAIINRNALGEACATDDDCDPERRCEAVLDAGSFCAGEVKSDSIIAEILLCENPWPERARDGSWEPYIDDTRDLNNDGVRDRAGTQFSLFYCRDAGQASNTADDLPRPLGVVPIPSPEGSDILLDLLLPMDCASGSAALCEDGDAMGVRVVVNAGHVSPLRWYASQGFSGSPSPTTVDGYPGIVDGRTTYVNAGNKFGDPLYTNIYLLSYNEGASNAMRGIFNQALANFTLNHNLLAQDAGICRAAVCSADAASSCVVDTDCVQGQSCSGSVSCTTDLDCAGIQSVCDAPKDKFRRDIVRWQDFRDIESSLETARTLNQHCSVSRDRACFTDANCPASEACVGEYPGLAAGSFLRGLSTSKWPSWQATLGNELGAAIASDPLNRFGACPADADPETCWNVSSQQFACPADSHVYQYRKAAGRGYTLGADFEFQLCSDGLTVCADDSDCAQGETCGFRGWVPQGPIDHTEGAITVDNQWQFQDVCTGVVFNAGQACGDGLVGPEEVCDGTMTRLDPCVMAEDGRQGFARVSCTNACVYQGVGEVACEAGRCGDGVVQGPDEICDDGNLNGTFGRCNFDCTALGDHCGDGRTEPGVERCDRGGYCARNPNRRCFSDAGCNQDEGQCLGTTIYNSNQIFSCAFDCKNYGPYCGDDVKNGREECDGNSETRACGQLENGRPTSQTRTCKSNCDWLTPAERAERALGFIDEWGPCVPSGACGDGVVQADAGEACDDGNRTETDACKNDCKANVCGDGSIYVGREACDDGADNIRPGNTTALDARRAECTYGQICNYCTTTCATATITAQTCGDRIVNLGYEICERCPVNDALCGRSTWQRICTGTGSFCSSHDDCPQGQTCRQATNIYSTRSVCAPDCASACPPTYETANLAFREIIGGVPSNRYTDTALLESGEQKYNLHIPSCRWAKTANNKKTVKADIEVPEPKVVNVVFVIDVSKSMCNQLVFPIAEDCDDYRLGDVRDAVSKDADNAIDKLYDTYYPGLGLMRIGIVDYSSTNHSRLLGLINNPDTRQGINGDEDWDNASAHVLVPLVGVEQKNDLHTAVNGMVGVNTDYMAMGIYRAHEMLEELPRDEVKIMVLLSDGTSKCGDPDAIHAIPGDESEKDEDDEPVLKCYADGRVQDITEPLATHEADLAKEDGIIIYTATIGSSNADYVRRMKERSSECPDNDLSWRARSQTWTSNNPEPCSTWPKYAYSGTDVRGMYGAIVDSITQIDVRVGNSSSRVSVRENRTLNLPSGFACSDSTQDLPFSVNYGGGADVRISNVRFDNCPL